MAHIDLDELERLAKAATPGPWEAGDVWVFTGPIYPDDRRLANVLGMTFADEARASAERERGLRNAAHIAAAHPQTVLALIERVKRAETQRDRHERAGIDSQKDCLRLEVRLERAEAVIAAVAKPVAAVLAKTDSFSWHSHDDVFVRSTRESALDARRILATYQNGADQP